MGREIWCQLQGGSLEEGLVLCLHIENGHVDPDWTAQLLDHHRAIIVLFLCLGNLLHLHLLTLALKLESQHGDLY